MIDLVGKKISTVSGNEYLLNEIVAQGAQGVVYKESSGEYMIKLYFPANEIQRTNQIKKIKWLIRQNYPERFIMPLELIEEPYLGYSMKRVKGHFQLNKLLIPSKEIKFSEWYNGYAGGLRRRLYLAYQIAYSFHILHKDNKAYCDISGNNILVAEGKSIASVCMIDIDNLYVPGMDKSSVLGTLRYMAPEISNNQMQPDILTDDYSLAVIIFELLRVAHPFIGDKIYKGTPDMENEAFQGKYPYIDDEDQTFNKSTQSLPADTIFNSKLKSLFEKTFIDGKNNRMMRTTAFEFAQGCLYAANNLMKCKHCGAWYYPVNQENNKYNCPWCEKNNDRPNHLQFGDDCKIIINGNAIRKEPERIQTYILKESKNDITNNYILRDMYDIDFKSYFKVGFSREQKKYYLLNPDNNGLWLLKNGTKIPIEVNQLDEKELSKNDIIYFGKPSEFEDEQSGVKMNKIRRFAQVK